MGMYKHSQSFGSMSHQTQSPDFNALYSGGPFRGNGGRDASPGSSDSHDNASGYVGCGYDASVMSGRADEEQPILPAFNQAAGSPNSYSQMPRRQPSELELPSEGYGFGASSRSPPPPPPVSGTGARRISLRDDGPTDFAEPVVRRVPRSSSKRSSFSQSGYPQAQQTYRGVTSPNANPSANLPPGAVSVLSSLS